MATLRGWKWLNKFLAITYFRESSRRAVVTIICLRISFHSHLHIHCLVLHEGLVQLNTHLCLIYKVLANIRDSAFLHIAIE
jgi:hypothetical protein